MPPTRGATSKSAAITGNGRGRCRVFTRNTPKLKTCSPDRRVEGSKPLVDADNQLAPQLPPADGATKARTPAGKTTQESVALARSHEESGFPLEHPGGGARTPPRRRLQGGHDAKKGAAAVGTSRSQKQDFRPAESRNLTPAAKGRPDHQHHPARRLRATATTLTNPESSASTTDTHRTR
jgi:hypothetical protein